MRLLLKGFLSLLNTQFLDVGETGVESKMFASHVLLTYSARASAELVMQMHLHLSFGQLWTMGAILTRNYKVMFSGHVLLAKA